MFSVQLLAARRYRQAIDHARPIEIEAYHDRGA
jgi:hypothetical protein